MENYYTETIAKIQQLISQNELTEAYRLVKNELSLIYVPKIYEDEFKKLEEQIVMILGQDQTKKIHFTTEETLEIILKNDSNFIAYALSNLINLNLLPYTKELQDIFNAKISNSIKGIVYNVLAMQKQDFNYSINNNILNPLSLGVVSDKKEYKDFLDQIKNLFDKDVTLTSAATELLHQYLLNFWDLFLLDQLNLNILDVLKELVYAMFSGAQMGDISDAAKAFLLQLEQVK